MKEALEQGSDLATCTRKVLERVKSADLGEALLDAYGDRLIEQLWRDHQDHDDGHDRRGNANGVAKAAVAAGIARAHQPEERRADNPRNDVVAVVRHPRRAPSPGSRRVDVEQLATRNAILECLFQVDGEWVRLGDLDKRQCIVLQLKHEETASRAHAQAKAFGELAAHLADGQTVGQRWTAKQIEALFGDTLSGAAPTRPT